MRLIAFILSSAIACLIPIPAQGVGVRDAHVAASVRAGGGMPFPRR
jgi:hypothetical protein